MSTTTSQLAQQLVVFSLGAEEYALPIMQVQEIIRYTEPRAVASEADWIKGVISLRGKIVPVCDLAARLGLPADVATDAKIIIVETGGVTAGVIVDDVAEVLTVDASQLDSVPAAGTNFIDAVAKINDRLVVMLNPEGIFSGVEFDA